LLIEFPAGCRIGFDPGDAREHPTAVGAQDDERGTEDCAQHVDGLKQVGRERAGAEFNLYQFLQGGNEHRDGKHRGPYERGDRHERADARGRRRRDGRLRSGAIAHW